MDPKELSKLKQELEFQRAMKDVLEGEAKEAGDDKECKLTDGAEVSCIVRGNKIATTLNGTAADITFLTITMMRAVQREFMKGNSVAGYLIWRKMVSEEIANGGAEALKKLILGGLENED